MSNGQKIISFLKIAFWFILYFSLLFLTGYIIYPDGGYLGAVTKVALIRHLEFSFISVFTISSIIVVLNRFLRKDTWYSTNAISKNYLWLIGFHFFFVLWFLNSFHLPIHVGISTVFLLVSRLLEKKYITAESCCVREDLWGMEDFCIFADEDMVESELKLGAKIPSDMSVHKKKPSSVYESKQKKTKTVSTYK